MKSFIDNYLKKNLNNALSLANLYIILSAKLLELENSDVFIYSNTQIVTLEALMLLSSKSNECAVNNPVILIKDVGMDLAIKPNFIQDIIHSCLDNLKKKYNLTFEELNNCRFICPIDLGDDNLALAYFAPEQVINAFGYKLFFIAAEREAKVSGEEFDKIIQGLVCNHKSITVNTAVDLSCGQLCASAIGILSSGYILINNALDLLIHQSIKGKEYYTKVYSNQLLKEYQSILQSELSGFKRRRNKQNIEDIDIENYVKHLENNVKQMDSQILEVIKKYKINETLPLDYDIKQVCEDIEYLCQFSKKNVFIFLDTYCLYAKLLVDAEATNYAKNYLELFKQKNIVLRIHEYQENITIGLVALFALIVKDARSDKQNFWYYLFDIAKKASAFKKAKGDSINLFETKKYVKLESLMLSISSKKENMQNKLAIARKFCVYLKSVTMSYNYALANATCIATNKCMVVEQGIDEAINAGIDMLKEFILIIDSVVELRSKLEILQNPKIRRLLINEENAKAAQELNKKIRAKELQKFIRLNNVLTKSFKTQELKENQQAEPDCTPSFILPLSIDSLINTCFVTIQRIESFEQLKDTVNKIVRIQNKTIIEQAPLSVSQKFTCAEYLVSALFYARFLLKDIIINIQELNNLNEKVKELCDLREKAPLTERLKAYLILANLCEVYSIILHKECRKPKYLLTKGEPGYLRIKITVEDAKKRKQLSHLYTSFIRELNVCINEINAILPLLSEKNNMQELNAAKIALLQYDQRCKDFGVTMLAYAMQNKKAAIQRLQYLDDFNAGLVRSKIIDQSQQLPSSNAAKVHAILHQSVEVDNNITNTSDIGEKYYSITREMSRAYIECSFALKSMHKILNPPIVNNPQVQTNDPVLNHTAGIVDNPKNNKVELIFSRSRTGSLDIGVDNYNLRDFSKIKLRSDSI